VAPLANDPVAETFTFILRSTSARPQTEAEVAGRLRSHEVPHDIAAAALAKAKACGAIDDTGFARAWVEERGSRRRYGVLRVRDELRRRLVPEAIIATAIAALDGRDDFAVALEVARERSRLLPASLSREAAARRLHGYLTRRGYPNALAERVVMCVIDSDLPSGS
jgi:regulatory protein